MATADLLDRGVKGGFEAIKVKMRALSQEIKELEKNEQDWTAAKNDARRKNHSAFVRMTELTMQIGEKEEHLRKKTEKLKYELARLNEKEGHLTRVKNWNQSITQVPPEELEDLQKHVKTAKNNYLSTKQKLTDARLRVTTLEDTIERKDHKFQDMLRREDQLRNECEHQQKEFELKKKRDDKQHTATVNAEEKVQKMEKGYYNARRRHETASAALIVLEAKIAKVEVICEELKKKRLAMESTLRELLSSYSKNREIAPPPNYPQAGLAVNSSTHQ